MLACLAARTGGQGLGTVPAAKTLLPSARFLRVSRLRVKEFAFNLKRS
jgi:hypothetical protein